MFKSKNLTLLLIGIMLFSLLLAVIGITLPITRKSEKIEAAGSESMMASDAIAIAMGHYSATSLRLLQEYPSESVAYRSMCGLLERMREHYGFLDVYTITRNNMGYFYVLDSRFVQENSAYRTIGSAVDFSQYNSETQKLLDDICDGTSSGGFLTRAIEDENGSHIIAAAPIMDGDRVLTVLCMDISLNGIDFNHFWFINFDYVAWICSGIFLLSVTALILLHRRGRQKKQRQKGEIDTDSVSSLLK